MGCVPSLIANGVPAEEARGLLPHDTLTRLNYKTNLRNLLDHLGNRLCTQAQFEWRLVGAGIRKAIMEYNQHTDQAWQWRHIAMSGVSSPCATRRADARSARTSTAGAPSASA